MPVPKKRTSKSKNRSRRAHHALTVPGMSICSNCGASKYPHAVCESCGHHKGKQVIEPKGITAAEESFEAEA